MNDYLESVRKQFEYYKLLAEKTFEQVKDQDLFWQFNENNNSIAIIVNHLWGNMMSRWTDFLNSDGEKEWRQRDLEFENVIANRTEMMRKWNEGWDCLFNALDQVSTENLSKTVYIRNQGHSVMEAINRQYAHYTYHIGQIVLLGKMIKGSDWNSLSIPKGQSRAYNSEKFARGKHKEHFTDEYIHKASEGPGKGEPK